MDAKSLKEEKDKIEAYKSVVQQHKEKIEELKRAHKNACLMVVKSKSELELNQYEEIKKELEKEIKKSEAITKLSSQVLSSANIALQAQKQFDEYGTGRTVDIPLLGVSNQNLMMENKNLRRRLAEKEAYD
jgi:hypothetical protein